MHTRWVEDGMLVVEGRLTPEQGALLQRALAVVMEEHLREAGPGPGREAGPGREVGLARATGPGREAGSAPLAQRQADALAAVADRALGSSAPRTGGDRVQVVVHMDAEVLADPAADGRSALEDGPGVPAEVSRRLACDCSVVEVRHGPGEAVAAGG